MIDIYGNFQAQKVGRVMTDNSAVIVVPFVTETKKS